MMMSRRELLSPMGECPVDSVLTPIGSHSVPRIVPQRAGRRSLSATVDDTTDRTTLGAHALSRTWMIVSHRF
jgi:hypothetical protein